MDAIHSPQEPLAILPGLMCDGNLFRAQEEDLSALVCGGFYDGLANIRAMARWALDRLPARFNLLGHSMGGRVALEVVRLAPERVARLALVSTGVHPVREGEAEARLALRDIGKHSGMSALVDAWLPPMLGMAALRDPELPDRLRAMCIDAGMAVYEAQIAALLSRPGTEDILPRIACPTAVIVGAEDRWATPAQHADIAGAIPDARLQVVPGAGHMVPAEDPEIFNALLRNWLARPVTATMPIQS